MHHAKKAAASDSQRARANAAPLACHRPTVLVQRIAQRLLLDQGVSHRFFEKFP